MKITAEGEGVFLWKGDRSKLVKEIEVEPGVDWGWSVKGGEWGSSNAAMGGLSHGGGDGDGSGFKIIACGGKGNIPSTGGDVYPFLRLKIVTHVKPLDVVIGKGLRLADEN